MSQHPNRLDTVLSNGYEFQLSQYISKGFNIFSKNAGLFIGYLIVYFIISIGLSIIPILGQLASLIISASLLAGYYIVADKTERGEYVEFSNFFDGFKSITPLFISTIFMFLLALALFLPFIFYFIFKFGVTSFAYEDSIPDFGAVDVLAFCILIVGGFYLAVSFIYAPLFIVFDKMDAWQAMMASRKVVEKHMLMHIVFFIIWGVLMIISVIPVGLGLLVSIPTFYCSLYVAWADITDFYTEQTDEDDVMRHLID